MLKNRYDMGVLLKEFVVTSQSIVDLKNYFIEENFRLKDFANSEEFTKLKSLDISEQYSKEFSGF